MLVICRVSKRSQGLSGKPRRLLPVLLAGTMTSTLMMPWMQSSMSPHLMSGAWVPVYRSLLMCCIFFGLQLVLAASLALPHRLCRQCWQWAVFFELVACCAAWRKPNVIIPPSLHVASHHVNAQLSAVSGHGIRDHLWYQNVLQ